MIIYKMFKHEPMNNPALEEKPDWVHYARAKRKYAVLFCKSVTVALYFIPSAASEVGYFYRS